MADLKNKITSENGLEAMKELHNVSQNFINFVQIFAEFFSFACTRVLDPSMIIDFEAPPAFT